MVGTGTASTNRWSKPVAIDGGKLIGQLSCAEGPFCVGVDSAGRVLMYRAGAWSSPSIDRDQGCWTDWCLVRKQHLLRGRHGDRRCAHLRGAILVAAYCGLPSRWSGQRSLAPPGRFCWALDDTGEASSFNGQKWSAPQAVDNRTRTRSVERQPSSLCPSAAFCLSVDARGDVITYKGNT